MDLSGIIFVVLALAWAVYLVPKVLKHHDELARTRSVDRFSTAMRVLARREPVGRRGARLVVTPPRPPERILLPKRAEPITADTGTLHPTTSKVPRETHPRRAAARAAACRRRRILSGLLALDLLIVVLCSLTPVPWWTTTVPAGLTLVYLVLCRRQVRREDDVSWATTATGTVAREVDVVAAPSVLPRRAIRVDAAYGTPQSPPHVTAPGEEFSPEEDTVQIPFTALETVAVPVETVDGDSLWDPLPVTLPTYVGKARAARTVRTIDLSAPDTWSSGRDAADSALLEQVAATEGEEPAEGAAEREARRAVGS